MYPTSRKWNVFRILGNCDVSSSLRATISSVCMQNLNTFSQNLIKLKHRGGVSRSQIVFSISERPANEYIYTVLLCSAGALHPPLPDCDVDDESCDFICVLKLTTKRVLFRAKASSLIRSVCVCELETVRVACDFWYFHRRIWIIMVWCDACVRALQMMHSANMENSILVAIDYNTSTERMRRRNESNFAAIRITNIPKSYIGSICHTRAAFHQEKRFICFWWSIRRQKERNQVGEPECDLVIGISLAVRRELRAATYAAL